MSNKGKSLQPEKRFNPPLPRGKLAVGKLAQWDGAKWNPINTPSGGSVAAAGTGTVTSIALTMPKEFTSPVSGSPVTTAGTLNPTWASEAANSVFAGPTSGGAGTPGFRALVVADIPGTKVLSIGTAMLSGGTVVVSDSNTPAAGGVFLTPDGTLNAGALSISARSAGVSFTVSSLNILDARTFAWVILG